MCFTKEKGGCGVKGFYEMRNEGGEVEVGFGFPVNLIQ